MFWTADLVFRAHANFATNLTMVCRRHEVQISGMCLLIGFSHMVEQLHGTAYLSLTCMLIGTFSDATGDDCRSLNAVN